MLRTLAAIGVFTSLLSAQNKGSISPQHVPPPMMYHRVWAVTPLSGSGQPGDPQRPMFIPATPAATSDRSGVLAYQMWLSDDGKSALVEMVFETPAAFQSVLQKEAAARGVPVPVTATTASTATGRSSVSVSVSPPGPSAAQSALETAIPGLKMFERGKATQNDVLTLFQKYKANFQFDTSSTVRVQ